MNRQPEFKVAVSLMKQFCQKHNIMITHGQLLELAAIDRGYTNYHVYCAQEQKPSPQEKTNNNIVSDFLSIQKVFKPITYPSHDTKMMYEGLNNLRKDDSIAHVLSMLPAKIVYSKKELFTMLLGDFRWGRINGVAGEMRVNVENMHKLIEGKANFEDEIISFYYVHPFSKTQDRYQPETISIIAHVIEMITYLNYGQWYIPGIGCVNFNSQKEELISTEINMTLEQINKKNHTNFNIFINGEMVIDSICDLARAIEHTNSIAEDSTFGGIAELRDAVSHELIYFHAYGYQLPKKQKELYSQIQRTVSAAPLSAVTFMTPFDRRPSAWDKGSVLFMTPDQKLMPYQPNVSSSPDGSLDNTKITLPAIDPVDFQNKQRSEILNRLRVGNKNKK